MALQEQQSEHNGAACAEGSQQESNSTGDRYLGGGLLPHVSPQSDQDQLRLASSMAYRAAWMRDRDGVELELGNISKQQNVDTA